MDNLKETAARVIAWAKEHPYIAAAILGGVVLLAWLTIRNRGDNGGGSAGNFSAEDVPGGGLGASMPAAGGAGGGISAGGISGFGDLAELPVTESTMTETTTPAPSGGGGGFSSFDAGFDAGFIPAADFGFGDFAGGAAIASPAAADLASVDKGPAARGGLTGTGSTSTGTTAARTPTTSAAPRKPRADASPAYLAGKGQKFTGTFNGITYVNGYPLVANQTLLGYNATTGGSAVGGQRDTGGRTPRRSA